jgi:hypothetical protein
MIDAMDGIVGIMGTNIAQLPRGAAAAASNEAEREVAGKPSRQRPDRPRANNVEKHFY